MNIYDLAFPEAEGARWASDKSAPRHNTPEYWRGYTSARKAWEKRPDILDELDAIHRRRSEAFRARQERAIHARKSGSRAPVDPRWLNPPPPRRLSRTFVKRLKRTILHDTRLCPAARLFTAEMIYRCRDGHHETYTKSLATFHGCDKRTIQRWRNAAVKHGWLTATPLENGKHRYTPTTQALMPPPPPRPTEAPTFDPDRPIFRRPAPSPSRILGGATGESPLDIVPLKKESQERICFSVDTPETDDLLGEEGFEDDSTPADQEDDARAAAAIAETGLGYQAGDPRATFKEPSVSRYWARKTGTVSRGELEHREGRGPRPPDLTKYRD